MIVAALGLLISVQKPPDGPYWTWPTATIVERANEEGKIALKLEMSLVGVYRLKQELKASGLSGEDRFKIVERLAVAFSIAGSSYSSLGDQRRGYMCYQLGLDLKPSPERQAQLQNGLAIVCNETGRFAEAERIARGGLAFWASKPQITPNIAVRKARLLNQLGNSLKEQGRLDEALTTYEQSLTLRYQGDGPSQQAGTKTNIGSALILLGRNEEALTFLTSALVTLRKLPDKLIQQADTLALIADAVKARSPELGVVLLKESVSLIQAERRRIASLSEELRDIFVQTHGGPYRELADLLLKLGRVGEAIRVLDLLKEQEARDYFRGFNDTLSDVEKVPAEKELWELWQKVPETAGELYSELDKLKETLDRSPEQEQRYNELKSELTGVNEAVRKIYATLESESKIVRGDAFRSQPLNEIQRDIGDLNRDKISAAALRVFATKNGVVTLLVTSDSALVYRNPLGLAQWNQMVGRLALALRNPGLDPTQISKDVYQVVFGKAQKELDRREITHLVCALDGPLRYVPVSALWDGQKYLLERYEISYYTPGTKLDKQHEVDWQVAGFAAGVSQKNNLPELPNAQVEVDEIVQEIGTSDKGIYPGNQYIGPQFTSQRLYSTLDSKARVLHLATHFVLKNDLGDSFLMAGNDETIPLAILQKQAVGTALFQNIDLLYLSACSTAEATPGGDLSGDGREVDSFAMFALKNSALTVLATLWSLNDDSGALLAEAFYRIRKSTPSSPLGEVVKQAQLELKGKTDRILGPPRSGSKNPLPNVAGCPPFKVDPAHPYSHPYYWAPLVLYGSFR